MLRHISEFLPKPGNFSPYSFDSDWDYEDALQDAKEKYLHSKPLTKELEEDMNIEVRQIDSEE